MSPDCINQIDEKLIEFALCECARINLVVWSERPTSINVLSDTFQVADMLTWNEYIRFTYIVIESFSIINKYIRIYSMCCLLLLVSPVALYTLHPHTSMCTICTLYSDKWFFLYSFIGLLFIECFLLISFCLHILHCTKKNSCERNCSYCMWFLITMLLNQKSASGNICSSRRFAKKQ